MTTLVLEKVKIQTGYPAKLIASMARFGLIEKLSFADVQLDSHAVKALCSYLNRNYSLKDLNLSHLQMTVKDFAILLPVI